MLTVEPTSEMVKEWKEIFEAHHASMQPNRKTGAEVDAYFRAHYPYEVYDCAEFREMVADEILENASLQSKLPEGTLPDIQSYFVHDVLVGIDLNSGEFHIESEDINTVIPLYDDLFLFRGLDKEDLSNFFLVAEYVKLTKNKLR